jgi:ribosome assembly protein YihI (activator of Der GTPase)
MQSDANATLKSAAREARATLYVVMDRLEMNDLNGEEQPFIDDCLGALGILEEALR